MTQTLGDRGSWKQDICLLTVLEARRRGPGPCPLKPVEEELSLSLPAAGGSLAGGIITHLRLRPHVASSCVSPFLCLLMTLSWNLGSTLIHDLILKFLL